ncbi:enoyl-CoA hydratase [Seohaeicola saemankumensis]|nr:enoyl-CoA hydratase [Seohaeicola saemankumensis]MCA0872282.1 enoyl-CoA hydratase [Seohaeicola saemankumensis]
MSSYEQIVVTTRDRVTTIALNRPDRLNAWTAVMADEVRRAVLAAGRDPASRCIVITGTGRGFCAGADMDSLQTIAGSGTGVTPTGAQADDGGFADAPGPDLAESYPGPFGYFYDCPKPVIAAINGPCAGIGLVMTLYADLRFAATEAKFTTAFAARGLIAEHGLAWVLPRLVGEAQALDLLLTARKFTGAEAAGIGLVNAALPGDALMDHVNSLARSLAHDVSPRSMAVMKRQIRKSYGQSFAASLAEANQLMQDSFGSADFAEGVQSFVDRRPADFPDL